MKIKTNELTGPALRYAAALADGCDEGWLQRQLTNQNPATRAIPDYLDWALAGPIIERHCIGLMSSQPFSDVAWWAAASHGPTAARRVTGPTPIIAAMRCFVASCLGDEVEVPAEATV